MDTKQFLAEFGHIVNAPGGIQRLRELIFHLAVSGELVSHDEDEGIGNEAVQEAINLKVNYENTHKLRKAQPLPPLGNEMLPHAIPIHWTWERLGNIACYIQRGKGPKYSNNGNCMVVSQKCIKWDSFDLSLARRIHDDTLPKYGRERFLQLNDLLWNSTGTGTVGRACLYDIDDKTMAVADSHVTVIRATNFQPRYIWCVLASPAIQSRIDPTHEQSLVSGTTNQVELSTTSVKNLLIPCPPIKEQKRIVAKVDELMALCDKLNAQQKKHRKLQTLTRTATLDALADAQSNYEIKDAWKRVEDNLPLMFDRPEDVEVLKSTIMGIAIRGYLTQRRNSNASNLLMECMKFKNNLLKKKIIKRHRPHEELKEFPFELPDNWAWVSFSDVGIFGRGKSKHRPRNDPKLFLNGEYPFIQTGDVARSVGKGISNYSKKYNDYGLSQSQLWPKGTLCITIAANIADSAILMIDACFPDSVVGFIPFKPIENVEYFDFFIRTVKSNLLQFAPSTAQKNINLGILDKVAIPLPPRDEIEDIVKKVSQLMNSCDKYKILIAKKQVLSEIMADSFTGAITGKHSQEKETMKAPKTELVTRLVSKKSPKNKDQAPLSAILAKHNGELPAKALYNFAGYEIDEFYRQLKTEMARGWIVEPEKARMVEKTASAEDTEAA